MNKGEIDTADRDFVREYWSSATIKRLGPSIYIVMARTPSTRPERKMLGFGNSEKEAWSEARRYVEVYQRFPE
jgi:hypothetical protein